MPEPLKAKHLLADGRWAVRVETPVFLTVDQAAKALALYYADKLAALDGVLAIQQGINAAAARRLHESGEKPPKPLVAAYREILRRPEMQRRLFRHVEAPDGEIRSTTWLNVPQERATHVRTDVATFFDHEEAARACALHYSDMVIERHAREDGTVELFTRSRRTGRMTIERALHEAARSRLLEREKLSRSRLDQDRKRFFEALMREVGMFE